MNVAFIIHGPEINGCRYRVLQYLPYLKKEGVDGSVHSYKRNAAERYRLYNTLDRYDIVYIHRKLFFPPEFWYIRKKARKIIYDFDDAVMYRSSSSKNPHSFSRRTKFAYMMKRVDFAIAGNQFLKSEALHYNPKVAVVPTSIDLSKYRLKEESRQRTSITVGWLGSGSTLRYLKALMGTLDRLYQNCPHFQVKIVCDRFVEGLHVPVIKKRWVLEEEDADLRSFDIGLMPLSDDLWSRGKCGLKILQYYGVGIPVVCTPVGVNRDIVEDGVNGFWARDEDEWQNRLLTLIREEDLRRTMGRSGREKVEKEYSLEVNALRVLDVLNRVRSAKDGPN